MILKTKEQLIADGYELREDKSVSKWPYLIKEGRILPWALFHQLGSEVQLLNHSPNHFTIQGGAFPYPYDTVHSVTVINKPNSPYQGQTYLVDEVLADEDAFCVNMGNGDFGFLEFECFT